MFEDSEWFNTWKWRYTSDPSTFCVSLGEHESRNQTTGGTETCTTGGEVCGPGGDV